MKRFALLFCIAAILGTICPVAAEEFPTEPVKNDGKKWRIGYYEGGPYIDYKKNFQAAVQGLIALGWIEAAPIPSTEGESTKPLWQWLSGKARSDYLEFVPDAHYSADWNETLRKESAKKLLNRLSPKPDIDLMLALGTWAGQDLATDAHHVPTIVMGTGDPIASNIIQSAEDSGRDHIHARVDPYRYERQIRIFHDIIGFQKLGIAFEDTVAGRSYSAVDKAKALAEERGFKIVECHTLSDVEVVSKAEKSVRECFEKFGEEADAIYVTVQGGVSLGNIPKLVGIANSHRLPTFSQSGSDEVEYGFLMSISLAGHKYVGRFYAETIAKVLNGAKPRQLGQVFEDPPKIAINLRTAEIIGYDPPVDVLGAADEIYQTIAEPISR